MGPLTRPCALCPAVDDHPRHSMRLRKVITLVHFDCHAAVGCRVCMQALRDARGATGSALVEYLAEQRAKRVNADA